MHTNATLNKILFNGAALIALSKLVSFVKGEQSIINLTGIEMGSAFKIMTLT